MEQQADIDNRPLISYKKVSINQQALCVLTDIDFELNKGDFVYLIGKVGSGKSTFLKTIYAELDIKSGEANVLGYNLLTMKRKNVAALRRKLGIVFQDFQLLTDRTVHENLDFVLRATGWKSKTEIENRIKEVLTLVGMENKGYKMPNELSGGEQQRDSPRHTKQARSHLGRRANRQPRHRDRTQNSRTATRNMQTRLSYHNDHSQPEFAKRISGQSVLLQRPSSY